MDVTCISVCTFYCVSEMKSCLPLTVLCAVILLGWTMIKTGVFAPKLMRVLELALNSLDAITSIDCVLCCLYSRRQIQPNSYNYMGDQ